MTIKVGILEDCDSEYALTEQYLVRFFKEVGIEYTVTRYSGAEELQKKYSNDCDLLLMDILLPGNINGVDLARKIRKINSQVVIVFITATAQYALSAYEVSAVDYVLKPLKYEDFFIKLKKVMRHILTYAEKTVTLKHRSDIVRVSANKIFYIETIKHSVIVHTTKGDYTVRGPIRNVESQLSNGFAQCSSSFIVNLRYVDEVRQNTVVVKGVELPITRTKRDGFLQAFYAYAGSL